MNVKLPPEIDPEDISNKFYEYFNFISVLGNGAFGVVVAAADKKHGNVVHAVKIMKKKSMNIDFIDGLRKEAYILSQFQHPNIVTFKRIIETETQFFLVMECLHGGQLKQLIQRRVNSGQKFSEEEASIILQKITSALDYIHSKDIVHRDLKPENILLADAADLSSVKIVDFGLSVQYDIQTSSSFTERCGTKAYMAPELFKNMEYSKVSDNFISVTAKILLGKKPVDIWSVGIIMYQLLNNGKHPLYQPIDSVEVYEKKLKNFEIKRPDCSDLAKQLLMKLLVHDPSERYSAADVLQHPWITRRASAKIPLAFNDRMKAFYNQQTLVRIIKTLRFLKHLEDFNNKSIRLPIKTNHELEQSDSLTNSQVEEPRDPNKSDLQQNVENTPTNRYLLQQHKRPSNDNNGKTSRILLVGPQSIEELVNARKFKNKAAVMVQLSGSDAIPQDKYSPLNTSENGDLRAMIQANLKIAKRNSPVLSQKLSIGSYSPERDLMNSPERLNNEERNSFASGNSEKTLKRSRFSYSNLAQQILGPSEAKKTPPSHKKNIILDANSVKNLSKFKRELENMLSDRPKSPDDGVKAGSLKASEREKQDVLTGFVRSSKNRSSSSYLSQERASKPSKSDHQLTPAKVSKRLGAEFKLLMDSPRASTKSLNNNQKKLKMQPASDVLNPLKVREDVRDSPSKRNSEFFMSQASSPIQKEGRNSSAPKYSKDFLDKHQVQGIRDALTNPNYSERQLSLTKDRRTLNKFFQGTNPDELLFNNIKRNPATYRDFK